jgi:hypothetical protein
MNPHIPPTSYRPIWEHIKKHKQAVVAAPPAHFQRIKKAIWDAKYLDKKYKKSRSPEDKSILHFEERKDECILIITLTHKTDWSIL